MARSKGLPKDPEDADVFTAVLSDRTGRKEADRRKFGGRVLRSFNIADRKHAADARINSTKDGFGQV
nr:uncharacterized protein CTRU02_01919 [Colletotrichum truncatum]KAF6799048.1 hypothetical protein CTRU02_01919 [Colletotrichum truncatum]